MLQVCAPKTKLQLSTQCRRLVWVHWKIFQGWGLTQVRAKKPAILFTVCQHKALLRFLKCCVFSCLCQSRDDETQATRTGKLSLIFFTQVKTPYLRCWTCLVFWLQVSFLWYGKQHCKYSILSKEGIINPYLHATALALQCLLWLCHLQCSAKFPKFEYNTVKGRTLEERVSKRAGLYS